jgi:hypothetical protein
MDIDLNLVVFIVHQYERILSPYKTGNLRYNGIGAPSSDSITSQTYKINEKSTAPYAIILNESPTIRRGPLKVPRPNIHYKWHDNAFAQGVMAMADALGGTIE